MPEPVEIYTEEYYDRLKQIESDHWWTLGMTDIMDQLLSRHLPATGGRFLDVGCGSGIGLRWAPSASTCCSTSRTSARLYERSGACSSRTASCSSVPTRCRSHRRHPAADCSHAHCSSNV